MQVITVKIRGYNKKQVEDYLEQLRKLQENETSSILANLEACRQERNNLKQELNLLQEEKAKKVKSRELLDLALKRVQKAVVVIETNTSEEVQSILKESQQRVAAQENYCADISNTIEETKTQIDSMLQVIMGFVKEKDEKEVEEPAPKKVVGAILPSASKFEDIVSALGSSLVKAKEDFDGKMVVSSNGILVGRVSKLLINESTKDIEGFYLKEDKSDNVKYISVDYVLAVKKDSLVIAADWQKTNMQPGKIDGQEILSVEKLERREPFIEKKITADGTSMPETKDIGGLKNMSGSGSPAGSNVVATGTVESYWENLDLDLGPGIQSEKLNEDGQFMLTGQMAPKIFTDAETAFTIDPVIAAEAGNDPYVNNSDNWEKAPVVASETRPAREDEIKPQPAVQQESAAVSSEIQMVRHKYVVGKLAGEDLLDNGGQLIVRKNGIITPEIVERAEQEGKLADLIVNMVIPGLEE